MPSRRWRRAAPSSTAFRCLSPTMPAGGSGFEKRGLPLIGDDVKSQVGATIVHRVLANLFRERGVRVDRTYQLNFGGNSDFRNMLERERLESKKRSKTNSVTSQLDEKLSDADAHIGPSDFVPWLSDRKRCYIRLEGTSFGNLPINCRIQAGSLGFAEFGRGRDRRDPLRQAGARPQDRRRADRPVELLHEEPARAVHRLRGAGPDRGLHPRRARSERAAQQKGGPSHRAKSRVPARSHRQAVRGANRAKSCRSAATSPR